MQGASSAVLIAHGGLSPHQKRFRTPYILPSDKTLYFYSKHMNDTVNSIGIRLLLKSSTYDVDAPHDQPKNFQPAEIISGGEPTYNYRLGNAFEGDLLPPNRAYDVIHIAHGDSAMLEDVFTALKTYKPETKILHAVFCRAVFDRNRNRIYPRTSGAQIGSNATP